MPKKKGQRCTAKEREGKMLRSLSYRRGARRRGRRGGRCPGRARRSGLATAAAARSPAAPAPTASKDDRVPPLPPPPPLPLVVSASVPRLSNAAETWWRGAKLPTEWSPAVPAAGERQA